VVRRPYGVLERQLQRQAEASLPHSTSPPAFEVLKRQLLRQQGTLLTGGNCMAQRAQFSKMSDYRPKLPSNNAYDYYITAARQLKGGEEFSGQQPPTPQERRWIEANQGAFNTLRGAFGKPYRWPFETAESDYHPGGLTRLRNLARLVNARIRWAIATRDGTDAVHDWRIGFQMARHLQGDSTLNYLTGVAMEQIIHAPIIREIDFFSAHECREMAQTLTQSERSRDRFATVIEGDLKAALRELDKLLSERIDEARAVLESSLSGAAVDAEDEEDPLKVRRLLEELRQILNQPSAYQRLRAELRRAIAQDWQAVADAVSPHGGRYREPKLKEYDTNTLFGALASLFQPIGMLARRYWEQRTRRRMMLIRLRLREYRLREGRYPDSLEPLNLQELAIDPFSGQPFVYRLTGERYQLESSV
jgi:hypothetical protein